MALQIFAILQTLAVSHHNPSALALVAYYLFIEKHFQTMPPTISISVAFILHLLLVTQSLLQVQALPQLRRRFDDPLPPNKLPSLRMLPIWKNWNPPQGYSAPQPDTSVDQPTSPPAQENTKPAAKQRNLGGRPRTLEPELATAKETIDAIENTGSVDVTKYRDLWKDAQKCLDAKERKRGSHLLRTLKKRVKPKYDNLVAQGRITASPSTSTSQLPVSRSQLRSSSPVKGAGTGRPKDSFAPY